MDRRNLIKSAALLPVVCSGGTAIASDKPKSNPNAKGVLVDTTVCIGCRKCEWACNDANQLNTESVEAYEDKSVFAERRYPTEDHYTVVNEFNSEIREKPVWVKSQCMHCNDPACASACLVSAINKEENGVVSYDAERCMGCRYCMVACPFQANAYEYNDAFTPEVRKCTFCIERIKNKDEAPACVSICPPECLTYGNRDDLLALAHSKIEQNPDRYINHVYGEFEVGGTSWMYLANEEFAKLGFPDLEHAAPPRLTESIQHGVFRNFIPPLALVVLLSGIMHLTKPENEAAAQEVRNHE